MNDLTTEFYRFQCEAGDEPASAELLIFAPIGDWEDFGEVSAKGFHNALAALPKSVKRLDIHINSPGGSLTEAQAIYSRLADHASQKNVYIDGIAASAASIVAMVGHKVYIRSNATMMIHSPSGISIGNADDMRNFAGVLDTLQESMLNVYAKKTGQPRDDIRAMLKAETWMTPEQAVEKGFADEVRGVVKAAASLGEKKVVFNGVTFDLSRFHNIPAFRAQQPKEGEPQMAEPTKPSTPTPPQTAKPPDKPADQPPKPPEGQPTPPGTPPAQPAAATASPDAIQAAITAERNRVSALQALDRPYCHEIVQNAIKDGKQVSDIVGEVMAAMDKASKQSARRDDAHVLDQIPPSDGGTGGESTEFAATLKTAVANRLKTNKPNALLHSRN
jgi:ATP-dependent protease ClpP protease subunit